LSKKIYLYKMDRPYVLEADIRRHLPSSLLNLIMRCLQKNPKRRPSDAVQVFYELTKIQQECRIVGGTDVLEREMTAARTGR
jgi:serine/threonine protein kinase